MYVYLDEWMDGGRTVSMCMYVHAYRYMHTDIHNTIPGNMSFKEGIPK